MRPIAQRWTHGWPRYTPTTSRAHHSKVDVRMFTFLPPLVDTRRNKFLPDAL